MEVNKERVIQYYWNRCELLFMEHNTFWLTFYLCFAFAPASFYVFTQLDACAFSLYNSFFFRFTCRLKQYVNWLSTYFNVIFRKCIFFILIFFLSSVVFLMSKKRRSWSDVKWIEMKKNVWEYFQMSFHWKNLRKFSIEFSRKIKIFGSFLRKKKI